jgi:tetratricopeptide (TPR) repeat protein
MRIRLRRWQAWLAVAAVGVAVACVVVSATRERPVPEIPRPDLVTFTEREVQMDLFTAAHHVELQPRSAEAWGDYGMILRAYSHHPEADRCFQIAAEFDPADGRWPYLLGTHLADTNPAAAVEWLERAARGTLPPGTQDTVRARLAETLIAAGRPADALAALGPDSATSDPRVRLAAARAAADTGDDRAAAEFLGDLADHPLAARQALLLRAEICRRQGRTSYANYLAGQAADTPDGQWPDPLADPIRSRDRSRAGRLDEASRLLRDGQAYEAERLLRPLTADPSASDPRAFVGLAEALEAQGNQKGALEALARAVRLDPNGLPANYQIGLLHFHSGEELWAVGRAEEARAEFREAVTWLDKALAVNPDFGKGLLLKGSALHRFLGRSEDGLALLRRFVQLRPEVAEGHFLLGQALADGGQVDAAVASLRRAAQLAPPGDRRAADALARLPQPGRK